MAKLLVIEDTVPIRKLLGAVFQAEFEVLEAENGAEGLLQVAKDPPDVILCDLYMPVMDGKEFLKQLKSNPEHKHIPVMILSADFSPSLERELTELGAAKVVLKTSAPAQLVLDVKAMLA